MGRGGGRHTSVTNAWLDPWSKKNIPAGRFEWSEVRGGNKSPSNHELRDVVSKSTAFSA